MKIQIQTVDPMAWIGYVLDEAQRDQARRILRRNIESWASEAYENAEVTFVEDTRCGRLITVIGDHGKMDHDATIEARDHLARNWGRIGGGIMDECGDLGIKVVSMPNGVFVVDRNGDGDHRPNGLASIQIGLTVHQLPILTISGELAGSDSEGLLYHSVARAYLDEFFHLQPDDLMPMIVRWRMGRIGAAELFHPIGHMDRPRGTILHLASLVRVGDPIDVDDPTVRGVVFRMLTVGHYPFRSALDAIEVAGEVSE